MSYSSLYILLADESYYSLEIGYVSEETGISLHVLSSSALSKVFLILYNDTINVFVYRGVTYIGLESRRIKYEEDKAAGTNWVEEAIADGYYD